MSAYPYSLMTDTRAKLGLIVLQTDVTIEDDFRRMLPASVSLMVTRVPSDPEVTTDTLQQMEDHLSTAAGLFPKPHKFDVVGYGCTSGTATIGANKIAAQVRAGTETDAVTEPVSALIAACEQHGVRKLALLSPYIETVSETLRDALSDAGIDSPVFGSFNEASETKVAHIDAASIQSAVLDIAQDAKVDAVFLSCTNLRTLEVIAPLQTKLGLPVWSSNTVLAWHMAQLAGLQIDLTNP